MAGGVPSRLAGFAGGVAGFDGGLTGYAGFARCDGFAGFALYGRPCCEALELESELLFGGLPCWHPGGMRLIALSWSMMLSGIWDGKGSGTGESLAEMGGSLVVCWVAYWHKERLMWSRSLYLLSRNLNILLRSCPNVGQSWIRDVGDDQRCRQ